MLKQNFRVTNKEHYGMLWYFLEWAILYRFFINIIYTLGILCIYQRVKLHVKISSQQYFKEHFSNYNNVPQ